MLVSIILAILVIKNNNKHSKNNIYGSNLDSQKTVYRNSNTNSKDNINYFKYQWLLLKTWNKAKIQSNYILSFSKNTWK